MFNLFPSKKQKNDCKIKIKMIRPKYSPKLSLKLANNSLAASYKPELISAAKLEIFYFVFQK
jgi:hypothetical protein